MEETTLAENYENFSRKKNEKNFGVVSVEVI